MIQYQLNKRLERERKFKEKDLLLPFTVFGPADVMECFFAFVVLLSLQPF